MIVDRKKNNVIYSVLLFCFGIFIGFVWGYNCRKETEIRPPHEGILPPPPPETSVDSIPYEEIKEPQLPNDSIIVFNPDTLFQHNVYSIK